MNLVCLVLSVLTIGLGCVALWLGLRADGSMQAKVGGSVIAVIGVLGLIACVMTG